MRFDFVKILKDLFRPLKNSIKAFRGCICTLAQKKYGQDLSFYKTNPTNPSGIVLMQMVQDYEFAIRMAATSKVIADQKNLSIQFYDVEIPEFEDEGYKKNFFEQFFTPTLRKIHHHLGGKIIFENSGKYHDVLFIKGRLSEIQKELAGKSIEGILELKFEGILVGDLIYDTYLRFFHQPTIISVDKNVFFTIENALHLFYRFKDFLKTQPVKALVNTYSSYTKHGIPARICLDQNIEVFSIGSYSYVIQKLSKDYPYHGHNNDFIRPEKNLNTDQLTAAKNRFIARFDGQIDAAVSYMRNSAFSNKPIDPRVAELFGKRKRNIVIYAHDFFDSPHVNRKLQFPDLFQFLKQTLTELTQLENTSVFIKAHPNGITGCKEITVELVESFKKEHFYLLEESVSNLHIISLKPDLICTARGTVGLEMAYFGIPTVALFDNLYANFKFAHTCSTTQEYFAILKGEKEVAIDFDKEMIYSFYHQAYIEKYLNETDNPLALLAKFKGDTFNDTYLKFVNENNEIFFSDKFLEIHSKAYSEIS